MSISSVGGYGSGDASQILARMLSRLDQTKAASNEAPATSGNTTFSAASSTGAAGTMSGGPARASLSDQIVNLLVQLQQASPDGTQAASASSMPATDPVQQLFAAMDSDGDGTISEAETEKYIEGLGGTQQQADALFTGLSQDGTSGISESQLASAAAQGSQAVHHHHGHGGEHGAPPAAPASASGAATQVFNALDTNQDGVVSPDELAAAFATNGTTSAGGVASSNGTSDPTQLMAALDANGDGAVSKDEMQSFMTTLQQQVEADMKNMSTLMQMAVNSYDKAQSLGSNAQTSIAQSA